MKYHDYDMHKIYEHLGNAKKKNLILDTDTYNEIDDQFAVTYAMVADDINILALTAAPFHNHRSSGPADGMEKSYHELIKIRDLNDPEGKRNGYNLEKGYSRTGLKRLSIHTGISFTSHIPAR